MVEAPHKGHIDGREPREACQSVKDAAHTALLTRHAGQLTVGAVEDVGNHQQCDGGKVVENAGGTLVIETTVGKQHAAACADKHRQYGYRIGVDIEIVEAFCAIVAERTDDMEVEPILRLCGFQGLKVFLIHIFDVFNRLIPRRT